MSRHRRLSQQVSSKPLTIIKPEAVSLLFDIIIILVLGSAIVVVTRSIRTILFWLAGLCFGYALRISVAKLRNSQ